jgi:hypothetical protein
VGFLVVATAGSAFGVELEMSVLHRAALGERVESLALARLAHQTRPIELTRVELRAPGAKTSVIAGDSTTLQTSSRLLFLGHGADGTRAALALAPDGTSWALLASPELGTIEARGAGGVLTPIVSDDVGQGLSINCTGAPLAPGEEPSFFETSPRSSAALGGTPTYQAVVAIDTDNEFHHKKFANNTVAAETWIDELFLAMNVFYERDLDLRLLRGDTFFRLDLDVPPTYDNDPWTLTGSPASNALLNEFGTWWSVHQGSVDRVFAALLSGKSSASNQASGIAWLDGYCETQNTGGGYSVNQIFTGNFGTALDAKLVGHELGHNAGSPHTHCYNPRIDTCFSGEAGCHVGATSCPGGGPGTLMSYCHFNGCGSSLAEFHPTVIANISGFINAHHPGCVEDFAGLFDDGFETGNTSQWSSTVP